MVAKVAAAMMIGGTVLSTISEMQARSAQGDVAKQQADFQQKQLQLDIDREATQSAIESKQREQRLRRSLAAQRAAFGSGGLEVNSGTPLRLQEVAIGSINEEQSYADFATEQTITNLNVQSEQAGIEGIAAQDAADRAASQALFEGISSAGKTVYNNKDLF